MGSISASVELYDRMSTPLMSICSALNQTISTMYDMNDAMDNAMDTSSLDDALNSINQASAAIEEMGQNVDQNTREQNEFNQSMQAGADSSNKLLGNIMRMAAAYLTIQTAGKVLDVSDQLTATTARIGMMNDGLQSTDDLMKTIYVAAQDSRGSFDGMADVVARFGNNAKDAFSSSQEVVAFANIIQKQMTIAGAGTQEASNAMLQLSQALGSGVLRGDELNSIFEQAPNLIQSIADYLEVPIGTIREMASEGELSADVVKAAIFASADEVNAKFEEMPMTFSQIWQSFQNSALMAFQPVLQNINDMANSDSFQGFVESAINALAIISQAVLDIFTLIGEIGTFVSDNWSIIEPIVLGVATAMGIYTAALIANNIIQGISATVSGIKAAATAMETGATFAATAAQYGFNAALLACPITWIIIAIIAVIALIFAVCSAIAKMTGIANSGFGVITGGINVAIQFFKNLGLTVANIALGIWEALGACASNMGTAFHNVICNIQSWFYGLLSSALTVVEGICAALNKLPFVEFDYSGISSAADDYAAKSAEAANNKEEYKNIGDAFNSGMSTFDTFQDGWASDAFTSGAAWGDGVADKVSSTLDGFFGDGTDLTAGVDTSFLDSSQWADGVAKNGAATADNTGALKDSVDITNENLKYLRDAAETEAINRFTTAEITVSAPVNATINSDMDIDGVVGHLSDGVLEAMEQAAEGVHE